MAKWQDRTVLMLGGEDMEKLRNSHVLVVGLGGVGAYAAEQLCRAGIGQMTIVDGDVVEQTNRNRQLPALISNEGKPKAEIVGERFKDINPDLNLRIVNEYLRDQRMIDLLNDADYDYVVDAIDTLAPKIFLIYHSVQAGLPIVSSMGAGGKFDPALVQQCDISKSYNCRLAKMIRKSLNKMDVRKGVQVIFSPEQVDPKRVRIEEGQNKKSAVGTISYMPPIFGCFCASAVIRDLLKE
ncbi:tRNA threonylcarbamoyladenosine dehydratase [Sunxiuqinia sp. sy24]|uniref:tRNA threonylcarbamoyladenosine dehydratase n=1 Tax=Sunxiuqinia sp. sy24 TaxID=3461495 RepID=UPI0040458253